MTFPTNLDEALLFPEEALVSYSSILIGDCSLDFTVHGAIRARRDAVTLLVTDADHRNKRIIAPICEYGLGVLAFKSFILQTGCVCEWASDGLPKQGGTLLAVFPDNVSKLISSAPAVAAYLRSGRPETHVDPFSYHVVVESLLEAQMRTGRHEDVIIVEGRGVASLPLCA